MIRRVLFIVLTALAGLFFHADCSAQALFIQKEMYNLYKKIPVVCWHKEHDDRFELEIEASFASPAETMDVYVIKDHIPGNDTAFVCSNIRGIEYSYLECRYILGSSWMDRATIDSINRMISIKRRILCDNDSIFIVRIMDDNGDSVCPYDYFGIKRNGRYEYGRTDLGPDTWTFPEMIEKAFGSMENFRKQYLQYVERVLYGRPKPIRIKPDDGRLNITG